jgi:hypothetical protein
MNGPDAALAWIGLAIAIIVLNDFGWGQLARYTLVAVIVYGVLTRTESLSPLFAKFQAGLAAPLRRKA